MLSADLRSIEKCSPMLRGRCKVARSFQSNVLLWRITSRFVDHNWSGQEHWTWISELDSQILKERQSIIDSSRLGRCTVAATRGFILFPWMINSCRYFRTIHQNYSSVFHPIPVPPLFEPNFEPMPMAKPFLPFFSLFFHFSFSPLSPQFT